MVLSNNSSPELDTMIPACFSQPEACTTVPSSNGPTCPPSLNPHRPSHPAFPLMAITPPQAASAPRISRPSATLPRGASSFFAEGPTPSVPSGPFFNGDNASTGGLSPPDPATISCSATQCLLLLRRRPDIGEALLTGLFALVFADKRPFTMSSLSA